MRALATALLLVAALTASVSAQDAADQKHDGKFTGIAIITKDLKWYDLFNKPDPPQISGEDTFRPGERGALVLIFSNPEPRQGFVKI